jgi:hypothetical protein
MVDVRETDDSAILDFGLLSQLVQDAHDATVDDDAAHRKFHEGEAIVTEMCNTLQKMLIDASNAMGAEAAGPLFLVGFITCVAGTYLKVLQTILKDDPNNTEVIGELYLSIQRHLESSINNMSEGGIKIVADESSCIVKRVGELH